MESKAALENFMVNGSKSFWKMSFAGDCFLLARFWNL